jgi:hypothetical protein
MSNIKKNKALSLFCFGFVTILLSFIIVTRVEAQENTNCNLITSKTESIPSGYGSPINFFSGKNELMMNVTCTSKETVTVHIGSDESIQYIYKYGYRKLDGEWKKITFTGTETNGVWIMNNASASFEGVEKGETGKVIAYICQKVEGIWKCGCENEQCSTPKWQLQKYTVKESVEGNDDIDTTTVSNPESPLALVDTSSFDSDPFDITAYDISNFTLSDEDRKMMDKTINYVPEGYLSVYYPSSYIGLPGDSIVLTGTGFEKSPTNDIVWNGVTQEKGVASLNGSKLIVKIPTLQPGKYTVGVKTGGTLSKYSTFLWIGTGDGSVKPKITKITPEIGKQGDTFVVHGEGFTKENNEIRTTFGLVEGLASEDGKSVSFTYNPFDEKLESFTPSGEPFHYRQPVFVTVMNTSGVSNTSSFKLEI